jgi:hypothetical protein
MNNPYTSPEESIAAAEDSSVLIEDKHRPLGVSILAVCSGLLAAFLACVFVILLMNWQENNEYFRSRRMAPALFWVISSLTFIVLILTTIGMWRGAKWSWWITCSLLTLYVVQHLMGVGSLAIAIAANRFEWKTIILGIRALFLLLLFSWILNYWLGIRVRIYFQFEHRGSIVHAFIAGLVGFGVVFILTTILFFLDRYWLRG